MTNQGTTFDKYVESLIQLRDQINSADPGLASRLPVCTFAGEVGSQALTTDPGNPGVAFIQGAHWHRGNEGSREQGQHGNINMAGWPECILLK
jgi:hypothetical protein